MTAPMLEARHIAVQFGGLKAVNDVSFQVWPNEVFSLIGPNGAGKTTIFNLISGLYSATSGEITFEGEGGVLPVRVERSHEDAAAQGPVHGGDPT